MIQCISLNWDRRKLRQSHLRRRVRMGRDLQVRQGRLIVGKVYRVWMGVTKRSLMRKRKVEVFRELHPVL